MNILGISRIHNSAVTLLKDGDVEFHIENERLTNIKYDAFPFRAINSITDYVSHIDHLGIAGCGATTPVDCFTEKDTYTAHVVGLQKSFFDNGIESYDFWPIHHQLHAAHAFYNSGFDKAICIIKDGMGSEVFLEEEPFLPNTYGRELSSVYTTSYPANFNCLEKTVMVPFECDVTYKSIFKVQHQVSEGLAFQKTALHFGFNELDAGKVMGMAAYGKDDDNLPPIYVNNKINPELFTMKDNDVRTVFLNTDNYPYLNTTDFQIQANFAKKLQEETQESVKNYILKIIELTGIKKVCLSGGYFLNCVANYYIKKSLPSDVELYVEPVSSDAGTSIGAAKFIWHHQTNDTTQRPLKSLYQGLHHTFDINTELSGFTVKNTDVHEVADLLANKNVIAIYQGRSESGPRALGNRSILYDPRDPNGKDRINQIKNREWFRPFAGTVLEEYSNDWFDMASLDESPFMMYAVDVKTPKEIPAVCHIDNTCRIQTVNQIQNKNYYNLIKEFYNITGVPILFNTSLNLAGDCIAETLKDALNVLSQSNIDYLYLPEHGKLVSC